MFREALDGYLMGKPGYNDAAAEQALYYLGRERLIRRDYQAAQDYLMQLEALAARTDDDTYFKVLGRLRLGMVHDAAGQRGLAVMRYNQVLKMEDHSESRDRARRYLEQPYGG